MNKNIFKLSHFVILCCFYLLGCGTEKTPNEAIEVAKGLLVKKQYQAAIIELKNAISKAPENAQMRYLLGATYLNLGELQAAEKELLRAVKLNYNSQEVLPDLAKVYYLEHDVDGIKNINLEPDWSPSASAKINFYKGLSQLSLGDIEQAKEYFDIAYSKSSTDKYSSISLAYVYALDEEIEKALTIVNKIIVQDKEFTDAFLLLGQLESFNKNSSQAVEAFLAYQQLLPHYSLAKMYLAGAYLSNKEFVKAEKIADAILNSFKEQPLANQYKGTARYFLNDYESALFYLNKAIQNGLNTKETYMLAAISAFQINNYEQAYQYFNIIIPDIAKDHPAHRLFIATQIKLGYQLDDAAQLLSLDNLSKEDLNFLALSSYELIKNDRKEEATKLVQKLATYSENSPLQLAQLGALELSLDNMDGIQKLEQALIADPNMSQVKLALAASYVQNGDYIKALELAHELQLSKDVVGYNLEAQVYYVQGKLDLALKAYEKAYELFPDNSSSAIYLAKHDRKVGNYKDGIKKLAKVLEIEPNNILALNQNYLIRREMGDVESAILLLKESYLRNKDKAEFRLNYARVQVMEKNPQEAISILTDLPISKKMKSSPYYWLILGDSYAKIGKYQEALDVYTNWTVLQSKQRIAWQRKSGLEAKHGNISAAIETINKAQEYFLNDENFKFSIAFLLNKNEDFVAALDALLSIPNQDDIKIIALKGEILLKQNKVKQATPLLLKSYNELPTTDRVGMLFTAYVLDHQLEKAKHLLVSHIQTWPKDDISRFMLADLVTEHEPKLAQYHYEVIISNNPNHAFALNNLAWIEYNLGNLSLANELAIKAASIANKNSNVLDTAGWMSFQNGQIDEAVKYLKQAKQLDPSNKDIDMHLREVIEGK